MVNFEGTFSGDRNCAKELRRKVHPLKFRQEVFK